MDKVLEQTHYIQAVKLPNDRRKLEKIAAQAEGEISVWEGGFMMPLAYVFFGVGILITAIRAAWVGSAVTSACMLVVALFLFYMVLRWIMRYKVPFFTLTPEGLVSSVFKAPVPWRGIEDFQVNASKTNAMNLLVGMEFKIIDRYLPEEEDKPRSGSYYDDKKKVLMIAGNNFRLDMNRDKLIAELNRYRDAALARHKLQMNDYK